MPLITRRRNGPVLQLRPQKPRPRVTTMWHAIGSSHPFPLQACDGQGRGDPIDMARQRSPYSLISAVHRPIFCSSSSVMVTSLYDLGAVCYSHNQPIKGPFLQSVYYFCPATKGLTSWAFFKCFKFPFSHSICFSLFCWSVVGVLSDCCQSVWVLLECCRIVAIVFECCGSVVGVLSECCLSDLWVLF